MTPMHPLVAEMVGLLNESLQEAFEERAAIREFDAGTNRELAECLALLELLGSHRGALLGITCWQARVDGRQEYFLAVGAADVLGPLTVVGAVEIRAVELAAFLSWLEGEPAQVVKVGISKN